MWPIIVSFICLAYALACSFYYWVKAKSRIETIHLLCLLHESKEECFSSFTELLGWIEPYFYGEHSWSELSNKELGNRTLENFKEKIREFNSSSSVENLVPEVRNLIMWAFAARLSNSFLLFYFSILYLIFSVFSFCAKGIVTVFGKSKRERERTRNEAEKVLKGRLFDLALRYRSRFAF